MDLLCKRGWQRPNQRAALLLVGVEELPPLAAITGTRRIRAYFTGSLIYDSVIVPVRVTPSEPRTLTCSEVLLVNWNIISPFTVGAAELAG